MQIPDTMRSKTRFRDKVALLPLGNIRPVDLRWVRTVVNAIFGMQTVALPAEPVADRLHDKYRKQHDADKLLGYLFERLSDHHRIIGISEGDMHAAGRNFVFGYAHLRDGVGIISLARLREEWYGRKANPVVLRSRIYRCMVHELGHTFGVPHCEDKCVMHACSDVASLDGLSESFCGPCLDKVRTNQAVYSKSAEGVFRQAAAVLRRRYVVKAVALYQQAVDLAPSEARYHNDLGVACLSVADKDKARAAFERAAGLDANFPHPHYNLAILTREDGDAEAGEALFQKGIAVDPDKEKAHEYVAQVYRSLFSDFRRAEVHEAAASKSRQFAALLKARG